MSQVLTRRPRVTLGIESSCDETAAAVVVDGREVRSNIIASQIDLHARFGGVVPEEAARRHLESILPVVDQALNEAQIQLNEVDLIAVTFGPGLVGALLVGLSAAKGLALSAQIPLIGVHHLAGHIGAAYLTDPQLEPPFLCLLVSGAHSHIVAVDGPTDFRVLARTRDDAAGEAFDKIARMIGLGYPGGPQLDRLAAGGRPDALTLPQVTFADSLDFSFSGLKTAANRQLNTLIREAERQSCTWQDLLPAADFAASCQHAIVTNLADHTFAALEQTGYSRLIVAGGVAANSGLRRVMRQRAELRGIRLTIPPPILCTDNAAMIAGAGWQAAISGYRDDFSLNAAATVDLELWGQQIRERSQSAVQAAGDL